MNSFKSPKTSLGDLDAEVAADVITVAADIALVLDDEGVIRDLAFGSEELSQEGYGTWLGLPWVETVTVESRPKVEQLLREAHAERATRWREVNHPTSRGVSLPISYSAVQVGRDGRVVAIGRDLRVVAALQQQLVAAQQSMEREYARLRHAETRYRLLFQLASEAVLIVEAATQRIVEANPAAGHLLGVPAGRVVGRTFAALFEPDSTQAVLALLGAVRTAGRGEEVQARLADSGRDCGVSASLFRQDNASHFLVRLRGEGADRGADAGGDSKLIRIVETLPDALVVTDPDRRVLEANAAFLDMAQLATVEQARGEPIDRWLGRPGVDVNVLMANLREHGAVRNFATVLRGEYGSSEDVEVSAVSVLDAEPACLGFIIRNVGRRLLANTPIPTELPRSVEQLTELVGRVSMKELVRETTDVIERLCIEAALKLTGDNRASAAQMLGLSRQSLYAKLRRFGLGDLGGDGEDKEE